MAQDRLQLSRLELKYRIAEPLALKVRDFVSSHLEIDEYGATRTSRSIVTRTELSCRLIQASRR